MNRYEIYTPPTPVGLWIMPGNSGATAQAFAVFVKPNWFHRKFMQILLGWNYKDTL